ncbi:MAG: tetratricopeptide repeat protein [Candidatus Marinimicrobia bacterium]|nr:tetratricopeptide repeat protein [Candidatus Neomarinimicrobiota bacterium]
MSYINKALREKKNAAYCDTKAWILYRQGKFRRALKWVNNALKYSDVSSEIYLHKGNILRKLQRYEPAREAFRKALSLDPENTLIKKALEEIK